MIFKSTPIRNIPKKRKHEDDNKKNFKNKNNNDSSSKETLIKLKNELLEVEIYKTKLEAYKLERELKLPPSKYTQDIIRSATKVKSPIYCVSYTV